MHEFLLDADAARRLLSTVYSSCSVERALTPVRAGIYQALATRLGFGFQELAAITGQACQNPTGSRKEAEATFLAALVVMSRDHPTEGERSALLTLAKRLELGLAIPELQRLASQPTALTMLKPAEQPQQAQVRSVSVGPAAPATPAPVRTSPPATPAQPVALVTLSQPVQHPPVRVAPAPLARVEPAGPPAPVTKAPSAIKRHTGRTRSGKTPARPLKRSGERALARRSGERALARRSGERGVRRSGERPRRRRKAGLPAWALPLAAVALCAVAFGIWFVTRDTGPGPDEVAQRDAIETLMDRYGKLATGRAPYEVLDALRADAREALADEKNAAPELENERKELEELLEDELEPRWHRARQRLINQTEEKLDGFLSEERFELALSALDSLPDSVAEAEPAWLAGQRERVGAYRQDVDDLRAFLRSHDEADDVDDLEDAWQLLGRCEDSSDSEAWYDLEDWLDDQDALRDELIEEIFDEDADGRARRLTTILCQVCPGEELSAWLLGKVEDVAELEDEDAQLAAYEDLDEDLERLEDLEPLLRDGLRDVSQAIFEQTSAIEQRRWQAERDRMVAEEEAREQAEAEEFFRQLEEEFDRAMAERIEQMRDMVIGTGFYVTSRTIVTNAHVIEGIAQVTGEMPSEVRIVTSDGTIVGTLVAMEDELDLAIIDVDERGTPLKLNLGSIREGQRVYAYGYGDMGEMANTLVLTDGLISAVREDLGQIVSNVSVNPGNSGGPLVDPGGRWIGVVRAKSLNNARLDSRGFAIHGAAARDWLEAQGINIRVDDDDAPTAMGPEGVQELRPSIVGIQLPEDLGQAEPHRRGLDDPDAPDTPDTPDAPEEPVGDGLLDDPDNWSWRGQRGPGSEVGGGELRLTDNGTGRMTEAQLNSEGLPREFRLSFDMQYREIPGEEAAIFVMFDAAPETETDLVAALFLPNGEPPHAGFARNEPETWRIKEWENFPRNPVNGAWHRYEIVWSDREKTLTIALDGDLFFRRRFGNEETLHGRLRFGSGGCEEVRIRELEIEELE